mmetsp:Transcript_61243/g.145945  ORF Transcript_61243/g.145945 Transcript_61243/m.145945 type:complete len:326 (-) Transcript_61243:716-1693(-)
MPGLVQLLPLVGAVPNVLHETDPAVRSRADRGGCEVGGVDAVRISIGEPTWVTIDPVATKILCMDHAVHRGIRQHAYALEDDVDVFELPTALQVHGLLAAALHVVDHNFQNAVGTGKEVDVSNAEPRLLSDRGRGPGGVRGDGVHVPGIEVAELVGHFEHVQAVRAGHRRVGLVDEPGDSTRAGEVAFAAHHVHLHCAILAASADVLHGESAVTMDNDPLAYDVGVVAPHLDTILHETLEQILPRIGQLPRVDQIARPNAEAGGGKDEWLSIPVHAEGARVPLGGGVLVVLQLFAALLVLPVRKHRLAAQVVVVVVLVRPLNHVC